jgi:hypothetical protein
VPPTSWRKETLLELAGPVLAFLEAAARVDAVEEVSLSVTTPPATLSPDSKRTLPCPPPTPR